MLPVIARYQENYLGVTERFIYDLATNLKHHTNLMLTWKIIDFDRFPLDHLYTNDLPRYSLWWWYDRLSKYLLKRPQAYFEHILRKFDAKLIHAHFGPNGVQMLPLKRRLQIPLITSFHGYDYVGIPRLTGNPQMYTELFAEGEIFLVEGQYSKNLLISIGCPAEKIRIQRLGIVLDPLKFSHRKLTS